MAFNKNFDSASVIQPELLWPSRDYLASYIAALESGWSPNNVRPEARFDELALIQKDPAMFVASLVDLDAIGGDIELPPYCLGHIGYSIVETHRGKGFATLGLKMLLKEAPTQGLSYVYIHCLPHNLASKRVIEKSGGKYLGIFVTTPGYGSVEELKYRVELEMSPI
jgi:RimJ/RimL family protein N-acetyltransferase